jgi:hypothetical protein
MEMECHSKHSAEELLDEDKKLAGVIYAEQVIAELRTND